MSNYLSEKNNSKQKHVFVGMSGGVDSSVAAYLLKKKGYDVVGVFMRCYNIDGCAEQDAEDARRVAEHIGIPFYVWDFEDEYKKRVVEYMVEGYRAGITPNPDVMCNREIKFGLFLEKALAAGADYVATGHYVRLRRTGTSDKRQAKKTKIVKSIKGLPLAPSRVSLFAASDVAKDQSYFLWTLKQEDLKHCLFPIGGYLKSEVRAIARKAGLSTAEKKDSQGICFLGNVPMDDFLKRYIPEKRGALVTSEGIVIGEHHGAEFYTIGERHINADFKFPKTGKKSDRLPFYVAAKDVKKNIVTVAEGSENEILYRKELDLAHVSFLASKSPDLKNSKLFVLARVRYRQPLAAASLIKNGKKYKLVFEKAQKFIAPGQSAVFYSKRGEMLGGGVIV
jgi:tRNA-specific 2-thiouridylase